MTPFPRDRVVWPHQGLRARTLVLGGLITCLSGAARGQFPILYGVEATLDSLHRYDLATGARTHIAPLPSRNPQNLAVRPSDGKIFYFLEQEGMLTTIDPCAPTPVPVSGLATGATLADIAFAPNGTLYGIGFGLFALFVVDTSTGSLTSVGPTGVNLVDLAFTPDGTLYALCTGNALWQVNTNTAATTLVAALSQDFGFPGALAYNPFTGKLLGSAGGRLFDIDQGTGAVSNVRITDFTPAGMDFGPPCIPDSDADGLTNAEETVLGTNPNDPDSDDDGLGDGNEVDLAAGGSCPSPLDPDSDDDTISDGAEVTFSSDPCDPDSDADGLPNAEEFLHGTHPLDPDSDDDGVLDGTEVDTAGGGPCPSPVNPDSDNDGVSDGGEVTLATDPCNDDSDGDGVGDGSDPLPTEPGVTSGFVEDGLRELAVEFEATSVTLFSGPNANAREGRRNSLAIRVRNAAKAIASGNILEAVDILEGVLEKIDSVEPAPDWMPESPTKDALAEGVALMIFLIGLL